MKALLKTNFKQPYKANLDNSSAAFFVLFFSSLFILTTYAHHAYAEANKIVKWKDANGVTHYGDKLPAQEAGRSNSVLSNQGTVVKTNESFNPNTNKQETERVSAEQLRQDTALLASYSSVEEIDLAQARNLRSDQLALETLRQRLSESQGKVKTTNTMYAGRKMSADVIDDQKTTQIQISKIQSDIAAAENSITQTMNRFGNYRARYLELRPRNQSLSYINANKKTLAELEAWKDDASNRLNSQLAQALGYKRAGASLPNYLILGIQQSNEEVARADEEITAAKNNIKKSQQTFSK